MNTGYCEVIYRLADIGKKVIGDITYEEMIAILLNQDIIEDNGIALELFKKHNIPATPEGCRILAEIIYKEYKE